MVSFAYDIINGELLRNQKSTFIDCKTTAIGGSFKRRIWNEDKECYQDITAFYIISGGIEYGRIGMTASEYTSLCRPPCVQPSGDDDCPDMIFECQFELQFE